MFSVCLSVHTGGVYPSPSHNTSTDPTFFLGGTPVTGSRSLPGGTIVGYSSPRQGAAGGTPVPGMVECTQVPGRGTQVPGKGVPQCPPPSQDRTGVTPNRDRIA